MSQTAERLKQARVKSGYSSAKAAAEAMGVPVATYIQHENGVRGIPAGRAERYARFFRVTPEWLLYGKTTADKVVTLGPQLYVVGEVAAGVFKEAWKKDASDWEAFTGRADIIAPLNDRFGLRVEGDSMDLLYPPGTILECVNYHGQDVIPSGKRVIVQRTDVGGNVEATVKELYRGEDGVDWLVPRSTNPAHRAFRGDLPDSPEISKVEIVAVVVASTRPE
jgi:phage repressor protein C with HTH and peptisase S24 domain